VISTRPPFFILLARRGDENRRLYGQTPSVHLPEAARILRAAVGSRSERGADTAGSHRFAFGKRRGRCGQPSIRVRNAERTLRAAIGSFSESGADAAGSFG
jgi:hypothetical protein